MTRIFFSALGALALACVFTTAAYAADKTVPDVVGLDVDQARSLLEQAGFSARVETVQGKPDGMVVSQSPGGFATRDTAMPVTLSVGAATPKPGVGTPPADDLPPAGSGDMPIEPGADVPTRPAPTGPAPAAGALVWNGRAIPSGSMPDTNGAEIPSVLGQTLGQARGALRTWQVKMEQTLSVPQLVGTIVNQWPPAGSSLAAGETITIVTAVAERPSNQHRYVPQVEGRMWMDAIRSVEQGGFVPEPVSVPSSDAARGRVLAQSPQPGSLELAGQSIRLFVGRGRGGYSASAPAQPLPTQPAPTQPSGTDEEVPPAGSGDMPIQPGADEPAPVEPAPTQPPVEPGPTAPKPAVGAPSLTEPPAGESYPFKYGADFKWTAVSGAASYELELQEELPSGAWQTTSTTPVTGTRHRPARIDRGRYRWRVRGVTADGEKGRWSEYRRLYMY